ncbi:MAG: NAD(P)H-hydrate dehydratase [Sphingomonadales bacterium]|jgi:hydroxyethylthiazole kinase-like uncharacterized protein yjeF
MDPGLKIITSEQSRLCDALTMKQEGMQQHDLMDRAVRRIFQYLQTLLTPDADVTVICGPGNNGADGVCLASLLAAHGYRINTKICLFGKKPSQALAFRMLLYSTQSGMNIEAVEDANSICLPPNAVIIDALFGTGLTNPLQDSWKSLVEKINASGAEIISIDTPSGLPDEPDTKNLTWIQAGKVIAIQTPKPSLLYPEFKIDFRVVDCGISTETMDTKRYFLDTNPQVYAQMKGLLPARPRHSHKGTFGHTLLIGGNQGMHGAIAMAAKACYESGSGLTTALSPETAVAYLANCPGVMHLSRTLNETAIEGLPAAKYRSVAIGPGLGNTKETHKLLEVVINHFRFPLIADADALNILSEQPEMLKQLPEGSLLTPHPAEFTRLFGAAKSGREKEVLALTKSQELGIYILAKDTYSFLACPDGKVFYNGSGNARLARGGSGDALTGMIAGLFAQSQNMRDAALAGMYFSGAGNPVI